MPKVYHQPVLLAAVLEYLNPQPGQKFIDCTLGGAGQALAIAKRVGQNGLVLGLDLDPAAISYAQARAKRDGIGNLLVKKANFSDLAAVAKEFKLSRVNGILFDLGISSAQLADRQRGISFQNQSAPLKMSFAGRPNSGIEADKILNEYSADKIADILFKYGQERYSRQIAAAIIRFRQKKPLKTVADLLTCVSKAVPAKYRQGRIHPATKTWQALRIAVNQELDNLEKALPQAVSLLARGGRLAVISYHSLEDRIVKHFFKQESRDCLCPPASPVCTCGHKKTLKIITPKPVRPAPAEIKANPRSRSAKLRLAEKI